MMQMHMLPVSLCPDYLHHEALTVGAHFSAERGVGGGTCTCVAHTHTPMLAFTRDRPAAKE